MSTLHDPISTHSMSIRGYRDKLLRALREFKIYRGEAQVKEARKKLKKGKCDKCGKKLGENIHLAITAKRNYVIHPIHYGNRIRKKITEDIIDKQP